MALSLWRACAVFARARHCILHGLLQFAVVVAVHPFIKWVVVVVSLFSPEVSCEAFPDGSTAVEACVHGRSPSCAWPEYAVPADAWWYPAVAGAVFSSVARVPSDGWWYHLEPIGVDRFGYAGALWAVHRLSVGTEPTVGGPLHA